MARRAAVPVRGWQTGCPADPRRRGWQPPP